MNMLAFDTCFNGCSVAASWGISATGNAFCSDHAVSRFERIERGHAERLLPMIQDVMAEVPFPLSDLEGIVVTVGPGTFTGQRVGIAAARALSLASGARVASLSSLAAMAYTARATLPPDVAGDVLAVAVDARRGEIYFQAFSLRDMAPLGDPALTTPDAAALLLEGKTVVAVGSGAALLAEAGGGSSTSIAALLGFLEPDVRFISSASIVFGADLPQPLYLRPPDAKPQAIVSLKRNVASFKRVS